MVCSQNRLCQNAASFCFMRDSFRQSPGPICSRYPFVNKSFFLSSVPRNLNHPPAIAWYNANGSAVNKRQWFQKEIVFGHPARRIAKYCIPVLRSKRVYGYRWSLGRRSSTLASTSSIFRHEIIIYGICLNCSLVGQQPTKWWNRKITWVLDYTYLSMIFLPHLHQS